MSFLWKVFTVDWMKLIECQSEWRVKTASSTAGTSTMTSTVGVVCDHYLPAIFQLLRPPFCHLHSPFSLLFSFMSTRNIVIIIIISTCRYYYVPNYHYNAQYFVTLIKWSWRINFGNTFPILQQINYTQLKMLQTLTTQPSLSSVPLHSISHS